MELSGILWILTLVVAAFTAIAAAMRAKLMATEVTTPAGVQGPTDKRVMVGGVARPVDGVRPAPISGDPVLLAIATRVEEYQEQQGQNNTTTRRNTYDAGRADTRFALVDEQVQGPWLLVDSTAVTSLNADKRTINAGGGGMRASFGNVSFGGGRSYFEEVVVRDGDRLWATGKIAMLPDGTPSFDGRVTMTNQSPERQLRGRTQAVIGFGVVAALLAVAAALATAGVFGG